MTLLDRIDATMHRPAGTRAVAQRGKSFSEPPFWALDNMRLPFLGSLPDRERIEHSFEGYARGAGKADSIVFACFYARLRHYAQAEFKWQNRKTKELFGTPELTVLERPWPTGTTGDLLAWKEVDATFAGNSYWTWTDDEGRYGVQARGPSRRLSRMRPDWVWILIGSKSGDPYALDAKIVGFIYDPRLGGAPTNTASSDRMVLLTPPEVCHYAPVPDPEARFRGMSWLTPALKEIAADRAATEHKLAFFQHGATLQTIVALDKDISTEAFDEFVERFNATYAGAAQAYSTLFVGGGADVTVTSADLQKLDYHAVQGGGETRIAADAGVHPVVAGLSEGLQGSSLNAGNYKAALRSFGDGTLTHLWQMTCSSLQNLVRPPAGARLWIDKPSIAFMQDDARDVAEVQFRQASLIRQLTDAGWKPDAAVAFVRSNDLGQLIGGHSGLFSVQLQRPGGDAAAGVEPGGTNGVPAPEDLRKLLALSAR